MYADMKIRFIYSNNVISNQEIFKKTFKGSYTNRQTITFKTYNDLGDKSNKKQNEEKSTKKII